MYRVNKIKIIIEKCVTYLYFDDYRVVEWFVCRWIKVNPRSAQRLKMRTQKISQRVSDIIIVIFILKLIAVWYWRGIIEWLFIIIILF